MEMKTCTKCGETKPVSEYYWLKTRKSYHARCKPCYRRDVAGAGRRARQKLRAEALAAYGGSCACCGEGREPFLTIDHVEGSGNVHRRQVGGSNLSGGETSYRWLKNRGWPEGFQVLCANCNMAKERGVCPHQQEGAT